MVLYRGKRHESYRPSVISRPPIKAEIVIKIFTDIDWILILGTLIRNIFLIFLSNLYLHFCDLKAFTAKKL
jgi:hypothetical protein